MKILRSLSLANIDWSISESVVCRPFDVVTPTDLRIDMRKFGFLVIVVGVALCILPLTDYDFVLQAQIDYWGTTRGWFIRGGVIILGVLIVLIAPLPDD